MEAKQWSGLITNASPYVLPPGATAVQENLHCRTPGQLRVRDGMRTLSFDSGTGFPSVSIYPYAFDGQTKIIALADDGTVSVLEAPFLPELASPAPIPDEPVLDPGPDQVMSSYTGRFFDFDQEEPA